MNIIYANRILGFTLLFISKHSPCRLRANLRPCDLIQISFVSLRRRLLRLLRNHIAGAMSARDYKQTKKSCKLHDFYLAPEKGFEPSTLRLTAACSTAELLRNINGYFHILSNGVLKVNNFS